MYIKTFQQISKNDVATVGGKGASLGEMINAGIPVPNGFVVTTQTFKDFSGKEIPASIKSKILNAYTDLHAERVAVRSSAVAEDSSSASWAGQLESYLNVNENLLINSIKKCWDSIKSERAENYAKENHIPSSQLTVAVVVQKMVDSEISGVMFTANPVTSNENEIMIESAWGLGELLVQGEITPDNYVIEKNTLKITESNLGSQDKMLIFQNGQNENIPVPDSLKIKQILNSNQLREVAELGIRIENHYGFPCDIEWALEKGKFYIVQSRPITTLS